MRVFDSWWVNGWDAAHTVPVTPTGTDVGGHFIVLNGWDDIGFNFRNSWSAAWGDNGDSILSYSYVPYIREIGAGIAKSVFEASISQQLAYATKVIAGINKDSPTINQQMSLIKQLASTIQTEVNLVK